MADFITQCPGCDTTFKVTETQLNAAHGAVRCGACLQVFAANDYLIEAKNDAANSINEDHEPGWSIPDAHQIKRAEGFSEGLSEEHADGGLDEYVESGLVENVQGGLDEYVEVEIEESEENDEDDLEEDFQGGLEENEENVEGELEENAEKSLFEYVAGGLDENAANASEDDVTDDSDNDSGSDAGEESHFLELYPKREDDSASDFLEHLDEDSELTIQAANGQNEPVVEASGVDENGLVPLFEVMDEADSDLELSSKIDSMDLDGSEPVVGDYIPEPQSRKVVWFFASILAAIVLVGQFAVFKMDSLSRTLSLRPWYEMACLQLQCSLPEYEDLSAIRTTELVVRIHPTVDRALLVDAIVKNSAPFRQKFPSLVLEFTDLNNLVIARRNFLPNEYLGGEMSGLSYIPARTEVRLGLEIVDPGNEAFGYSLQAAKRRK